MQCKHQIPTSFLPTTPPATQTEMDFLDSSFFATGPGRSLPTPSEIPAGSKYFKTKPNPASIKFEDLNIIVKFRPHMAVEAALCLHMIRKAPSKKIPVPEVYGWRFEGRYIFIYMELIQGESLLNITFWQNMLCKSVQYRYSGRSNFISSGHGLHGGKIPTNGP